MSRVKKKIEYSKIVVEKVEDHKYKEDRKSAQIRQTVTKISLYPIQTNSKQDSLLTASKEEFREFKDKPKDRVCWVDVAKDATVESTQELIDSFDNPVIYQIVSFDVMDCLTEGHIYQINNPEADLTIDKMKESKLLRDKDDQPILKEGKEIYIARYFSKDMKEDENYLTNNKSKQQQEVENEESDVIELESPGSENDVA